MSEKSQEPANPDPQGPVPPYEDRKQSGDPETPRPPEAGDTDIGGAAGPRPPSDNADPGPSTMQEVGTTDPAETMPEARSGHFDDDEDAQRSVEERGRSRSASKTQDSGATAEDNAPDLPSGDQGG